MTDFLYADAGGQSYTGWLETPGAPNGAAVLIAHNAPGLGDHERAVARRLAALGYVALAADLHGGGRVLEAGELGPRMALLMGDPAHLRGSLGAALEALKAQAGVEADRIAAVGYCFGGFSVLELARGGADIAAVVGFHSTLPTQRPEDARAIKGKVLLCTATMDPYVPMEDRIAFESQMNDAGVDWWMALYGGTQHAFTVEGAEQFGMPGIAYSEQSDERSWRAMRDLFAETIDR
jgi:dienelactone hydrolase